MEPAFCGILGFKGLIKLVCIFLLKTLSEVDFLLSPIF